MTHRLGVDVGGTFTDLLLMNEKTGQTTRDKVPSTPQDPSIAVIEGIRRICAKAGLDPSELAHVMHGTTVATNAVLEGKGARVGLIGTSGYRQILQVARSFVPGGLAGWIIWPKPEPLAALEDTIEATERIDAQGAVVLPLDEDRLKEELLRLREHGIEALTISFMNSFTNPSHEQRAGAIAHEIFPDIPISLSSKILPEIREYERTLTTVANSYVRPIAERYLKHLEQETASLAGQLRLHVLRSDGGLMGIETATQAPVSMLMSGPAGGVSGAVWIAEQSGYRNLLTLDMGGTSTDVALVQDGRASIGRETTVGDLTIRASSVDVRTVGAGGGSIAHVPELTKALRVGPQSAGAVPGPAAYGHGGTEPTVTDANVVLGYLPTSLLGGEMSLDRDAAFTAVESVAKALGVETMRAAAGIIDIVNENMFGALRLVSVQQGYDPRNYALIAFGGAGPLHANALGSLMGSWPVIIPPSPGVLCAYGDATTELRSESSRTLIRRFSETSLEEVVGILAELTHDAGIEISREGVDEAHRNVLYEIDLRYHGQGFEVPISITLDELKEHGLALAAARFDAEHERLFTFALDSEHEIVNLRSTITAVSTRLDAIKLAQGDGDPAQAFVSTTTLWTGEGMEEGKLYDRTKLEAGDVIIGPAIVSEMDSTTLLLPKHVGTIDEYGCIIIQPANNTQETER